MNAKDRHWGRAVTRMAAAWLIAGCVALAQSTPQAGKARHVHKPSPAQPAAPMPAAEEQAPTPPEPEQPKWPANDAPSQPSVTWNSQGLHIQATNASLSKILNEVSTQTGAKVEGLSADERVFGEFGPGQPREVLSQLLHGSSYNFLLLGNPDGPLTLMLNVRHGGTAAPTSDRNANRPTQDIQQDDDQGQEPDADEPQPVQQPFQPPPQPEPENPQGAMTPQQRMQMMQQQRLQQMQQMQQQQQQLQQQQPQ
jgi:hypothetical protein